MYALIGLIVSIKDGFGVTVIVNFFIFLLTYVVPTIIVRQPHTLYFSDADLINIYLGNTLLSLFSIISGRVISDYRNAVFIVKENAQTIQQVNEELDRFVYSVSHDLIAPLKSIKGLANIMRLEGKNGNAKEYAKMVERSALKIESFINEILDYSRNTRMKIESGKIVLPELVAELLDNCRFSDGFDKIEFQIENIDKKPIVTDEFRMKIILNNLISNAIKFVTDAQNPLIKIESGIHESRYSITVEDNGPGIEEEYQEKIFDMFFRANTDHQGSGLGLYIAREAAKAIHAAILVDSKPSKGSKFVVALAEDTKIIE